MKDSKRKKLEAAGFKVLSEQEVEMTRHAFFKRLSALFGLDISEIMDLERQELESTGQKPSRERLEDLCRQYVDEEVIDAID